MARSHDRLYVQPDGTLPHKVESARRAGQKTQDKIGRGKHGIAVTIDLSRCERKNETSIKFEMNSSDSLPAGWSCPHAATLDQAALLMVKSRENRITVTERQRLFDLLEKMGMMPGARGRFIARDKIN